MAASGSLLLPCAAALIVLLVLFSSAARVESRGLGEGGDLVLNHYPTARRLQELVPDQPLVLDYHGGRVLGAGGVINIYILWYGAFTRQQRAIVNSFILSIQQSGAKGPSVKSWWKLAGAYKDSKGTAVPASVTLAGQASDSGASAGKNLKEADLPKLLQQAIGSGKLKLDNSGLYFIFTAEDVLVEKFCMSRCATHSVLPGANKLPWAWVGNSATQCAGMCAWPFAPLPFPGAPPTAPAKPPNGDVGIDGMVINIGSMLAGASTNPFGDAFYQGNALAPLEAATACPGIYAAHAYPGYPGDLFTDKRTGGNFNVYGYKKRRYLVPSLVSKATAACAVSA